MPYYIYKLVDSQTNQPFYVGITCNKLIIRLKQHLGCRYGSDEKNAKIQQLINDQVEIQIRTIEEVDNEEQARDRERFWIREYIEQGVKLYNAQNTPPQIWQDSVEDDYDYSGELDKIPPLLFRTYDKGYEVDYPDQLNQCPEYLDDSFADFLDLVALEEKRELSPEDIHMELEYFMLGKLSCCGGDKGEQALMDWYYNQFQKGTHLEMCKPSLGIHKM